MKKRFVLPLLELVFLFGVVSCSISTSNKFVTVDFDTDGGSLVKSQNLKVGDYILCPDNPKKYGFTFDGWYTDIAYTKQFDFSKPINKSIILYAKWKVKDKTFFAGTTWDRERSYGFKLEFSDDGNQLTINLSERCDIYKCDVDETTKTIQLIDQNSGEEMNIYFSYEFVEGSNETRIHLVRKYKRGNYQDEDYGIYALSESSASDPITSIIIEDVYGGVGVGTKIGELHSIPTYLPEGTDGTAGIDATYCYFGDFPQTIKADDVTVDESRFIKMGGFTYYEGNDGCYYVKDNDKTYIDDSKDSGKYFRVEPIKWRVLSDSNKKLLLAESVLIRCKFYDYNSSTMTGTAASKTADYSYSRIRAYLNGWSYSLWSENKTNSNFSNKGFLQTAFTNSAQNAILETEDRTDKIFLLSISDLMNTDYIFYNSRMPDNYRIRKPTDFYRGNKGSPSGDNTNYGASWWLRTPNSGVATAVDVIRYSGDTGHDWPDGINGVVPALYVNMIIQGERNYKVSFNSNGGSSIHSQCITAGDYVLTPDNPKKDFFAFEGWYTDVELTKKFDFSTVIDNDIILYAKWAELPIHSVNISTEIENGTVSVNKNNASAGMSVTLTVESNDGYECRSILVKNSNNENVVIEEFPDGTFVFIMPESDVVISAIFTKKYKVNIQSGIMNGTVTSDKVMASAGTIVTLTLSAMKNYEFGLIRISGPNNSSVTTEEISKGKTYTFVMPEGNVSIYVEFKRIEITGKIGKYGTPYLVGDIVFSDGSAMPYNINLSLTEEQKSNAIAVIFYVGNELSNGYTADGWARERTLGVGLVHNKTGLKWCTYSASAYSKRIDSIMCSPTGYNPLIFTSSTSCHTNGSDNFTLIKNSLRGSDDTNTESHYPAFYFALNYASTEGSHLKNTNYQRNWYLPSIAELVKIWENYSLISSASALCGGSSFNSSDWYLSSTQEYTASKVHVLSFNGGYLYDRPKDDDLSAVCVIREFGDYF